MKILFFVIAFPCRSETFVLNQIAGMVKRGHEVTIIAKEHSSGADIPAEFEQYKLLDKTAYVNLDQQKPIQKHLALMRLIINIAKNRSVSKLKSIITLFRRRNHLSLAEWSFSSQLIIAAELLKQQPEIVHCQFGVLAPIALHMKKLGILEDRLVVSFRGYDVTKYPNEKPGIYDELFKTSCSYLPVSKTLETKLVQLGCRTEKTSVHHSGIDCKKFPYAKRQIPAKEDTIQLISVARLVEKKGLEYAIQATRQLVNKGWSIQYSIIGDGPLHEALEQLITDLDLGNHVKLTGWKSHQEVFRFLQQSHILIAPSVTAPSGDQEGIPNSIKEAMALGLPVLGTQHGGIPELVEHGVSGLLVPERNIDALVESLDLLLKNKHMWETMGQAGRKHIEAEYDIEKLNDQLVKIYQGDQST